MKIKTKKKRFKCFTVHVMNQKYKKVSLFELQLFQNIFFLDVPVIMSTPFDYLAGK